MKCSCETLQNLPNSLFFSFFIFSYFGFVTMDSLDVYIDYNKSKVAHDEKRKKKLFVFFLIPKLWQILKRFSGTFR